VEGIDDGDIVGDFEGFLVGGLLVGARVGLPVTAAIELELG
jgi:hypothetical protein